MTNSLVFRQSLINYKVYTFSKILVYKSFLLYKNKTLSHFLKTSQSLYTSVAWLQIITTNVFSNVSYVSQLQFHTYM